MFKLKVSQKLFDNIQASKTDDEAWKKFCQSNYDVIQDHPAIDLDHVVIEKNSITFIGRGKSSFCIVPR
ncbi:MAG: hypothetical protein ACFFDN_05220 [Candidatus Hodarchaeota archaeon]